MLSESLTSLDSLHSRRLNPCSSGIYSRRDRNYPSGYRSRVLILVLVEQLSEFRAWFDDDLNKILILVLLEHTLGVVVLSLMAKLI